MTEMEYDPIKLVWQKARLGIQEQITIMGFYRTYQHV
jgi:hypothetical protein